MSDFTGVKSIELVSKGGRYIGPNMDWTPNEQQQLDTSDQHVRVTTSDGTTWELATNDDGNLVIWAPMGGPIFTCAGQGANVIELISGEHFAPHRLVKRGE